MAAPSLLGCGRAATCKVLRLEAQGLRGAAPSAALCTKPGSSGTPPRNVVAPQGSTKLLAIKAPDEFPKMLSSSSLLVSANKGESISSTNLKEASQPAAEDMRMFMARKTVVAFPQRAVVSSLEKENLTMPAREGGLRKELAEEQSSSSSSSDSDSSSDSEEEKHDSEVTIKTKVEFPRKDSIFSENIAVKASMVAKKVLSQKSHKEYVAKKKLYKTETDTSPVKQVAFSKTSVSREKPKSKAKDPKIKSAPKEADRQKLILEPRMVESQTLTDVSHKSDYVDEKSIKTQVAALQLKASSVTQEDKKQRVVSRGGEGKKMKKAQESEAEVTSPKPEEASENTKLVMGTRAKEETIQEARVQAGESSTIEETTAAAEPAPEEFDNSTYKNLQHHDYNIYTFFDSITVLSKFRQPQPSSGRPSPRH